MGQTLPRQLAFSFFAIGRIIREKLHNSQKQDPFSFLKLLVLKLLSEHPEFKLKDLATYLSITPPSVSSIIDKLVRKELLERKNEEKDRRTTHLEVTIKGREVLRKGMEDVDKEMSKLISSLKPKEQESLVKLLEKIINTND